VLAAAAVFAWFQVREAQRLRKEQTRPFVLIDFGAWSTIIELRITNIGKTIARDIRFEFDPPLETTRDSVANNAFGAVRDLSLFKDGIPSLAPGKEIKIFFDQFPSRLDAKLPLTYNVRASYAGHGGEPYAELMTLDLAAYVGTGGITRYGLDDIYKQVKTIADNVKRWTDFSGLKVLTRRDIKERNAEMEARHEEQAAAAQADTDQGGGGKDNGAQ